MSETTTAAPPVLSDPPAETWLIQSYALCILAYVLCAVYAVIFAKLSASTIKEKIGETTDGFITARKSQEGILI
jgi:hypothetical protein